MYFQTIADWQSWITSARKRQRKTDVESFACLIFHSIDSRRCFPCRLPFTEQPPNRKMSRTTTKYLGFKCQLLFSRKFCVCLSPRYWPHTCGVALRYSSLPLPTITTFLFQSWWWWCKNCICFKGSRRLSCEVISSLQIFILKFCSPDLKMTQCFSYEVYSPRCFYVGFSYHYMELIIFLMWVEIVLRRDFQS